jgi:hypothetical protein
VSVVAGEIRSRCCAAPVRAERASEDADGEFREYVVTASGHLTLGDALTFVCEDCECYCETVELRPRPALSADDPLTLELSDLDARS